MVLANGRMWSQSGTSGGGKGECTGGMGGRSVVLVDGMVGWLSGMVEWLDRIGWHKSGPLIAVERV